MRRLYREEGLVVYSRATLTTTGSYSWPAILALRKRGCMGGANLRLVISNAERGLLARGQSHSAHHIRERFVF